MKLKPLALQIGIILFIMASSFLVKVYLNASSHLETANKFLAEKNYADASTHFQRSLDWFFPGLDLKEQAAEGLWNIAQHYESQNDLQQALDTYRLLRGGFYGARSFYTPGKDWIQRCNLKIAELMTRQPPTSPAEELKSFEQRQTEMLEVLTKEKSPYPEWALLTEVGFFGWVTCSFLFIFRAMTPVGKIIRRPAIGYSIAFLIFYALWIWGMSNT